ncbi:MAG: peptide chain release factor N(5)-glutamine methyltransferase [Pseudomonadota bacterium]
MTVVQTALQHAAAQMTAAGVADPLTDGRRLMMALLNAQTGLSLHMHDTLPPPQAMQFQAMVDRRCTHEPVAKIVGFKDFWGRRFFVNHDVLDPRPDTETLIAAALDVPFDRVLDLGTGSGAIVLTLLAERPHARGWGYDISSAAVQVAQANAAALGLCTRVVLGLSDVFKDIAPPPYNLIVSNPPYIAADEMAGLSLDTRFDPPLALTDQGDGYSFYRRIAAQAYPYLTPGGHVIVEIGPTQGAYVQNLFRQAGFQGVHLHRDLDNRDRVVVAKRVK